MAGHIESYASLTTDVSHNFTEIGEYHIELTIYNELSSQSLSADIVIEPDLENYVAFGEAIYTPSAVPLDVAFPLVYINQSLNTPIHINCTVVYEQLRNNNGSSNDSSSDSIMLSIAMTYDYLLNHTYVFDTSDEIFAITCNNHVSDIHTEITILLRGDIYGIIVTPEMQYYPVGDTVIFTVNIAHGDHVVLVVDFGDGTTENYTEANIYSSEFAWHITHNYDINNNFTVSVQGHNEHFHSELSYTESPVIIQYGLSEIEVVTDSQYVKIPDGQVTFDLHSLNTSVLPDNVFCAWQYDDTTTQQYYSVGLMSGMSDIEQFTYTRHNIGSPVTVSIICSNFVSTKATSITLEIMEEVREFHVVCDFPFSIRSETLTFTSSLANGSHVIFDYDYGNGQSTTQTHPTIFANTRNLQHTYAFPAIGNYSINVTAHNPVSSLSFQLDIIVQNEILHLSLSNEDSVLFPPGLVTFTITSDQNQYELESIHCNWLYSGNIEEYIYINEMLPSSSYNHSYTFSQASVGLVDIDVSCTNLASTLQLTSSVEIILDEVLLGLVVTEPWLWWTNTSTFNLTIDRFGTNSCFQWNMGDGTIYLYGMPWCQTYANENGLTLLAVEDGQSVLHISHTYETWNVYTVTVDGFNHVSDVTTQTQAIIKDWYCFSPNITYNDTLTDPTNRPQFMKSAVFILQPDNIAIDCMKSVNRSFSLLQVFNSDDVVVFSVENETQFSYAPRQLPYGLYSLRLNLWMLGVTQYSDEATIDFEIIKTPLVINIAGMRMNNNNI